MPGAVLRPLCKLTYLMFSITQEGRYYFSPLSTEEETKNREVNLARVTHGDHMAEGQV